MLRYSGAVHFALNMSRKLARKDMTVIALLWDTKAPRCAMAHLGKIPLDRPLHRYTLDRPLHRYTLIL
jgi:hypothetical protein